jgi:O-antigen/teichoic acid export membrane protein
MYSVQGTFDLQRVSIRSVMSETWEYSRWALVGVTSEQIKQQSYIYLVTGFLGLDVIAEISVARMFLRPIGVFLTSSGRIQLAKGAELLHADGPVKLKNFSHAFTLFLLATWAFYVVCLWISYDHLVAFFGDKYQGIGGYVALWSIFFLVYILRYSKSNALLVLKEFKAMGKYGIISTVVTVIACYALAQSFKGYGALSSLVLGELVLLVYVAMHLSGLVKKDRYSVRP